MYDFLLLAASYFSQDTLWLEQTMFVFVFIACEPVVNICFLSLVFLHFLDPFVHSFWEGRCHTTCPCWHLVYLASFCQVNLQQNIIDSLNIKYFASIFSLLLNTYSPICLALCILIWVVAFLHLALFSHLSLQTDMNHCFGSNRKGWFSVKLKRNIKVTNLNRTEAFLKPVGLVGYVLRC